MNEQMMAEERNAILARLREEQDAQRVRIREERLAYEGRRAEFADALGVRQYKWSRHNLMKMLRATGETPERVAEMAAILGDLGMGDLGMGQAYYRWISPDGVWDHGAMWGRDGMPRVVVGHPYRVGDRERARLDELARFTTLEVAVDDRPSYYGHGTHHVRVELAEVRQPYGKLASTPATRAIGRTFAGALHAESGLTATLGEAIGAGFCGTCLRSHFVVASEYYTWCVGHKRPHILVGVYRLFAEVSLNTSFCECDLAPDVVEAMREMWRSSPRRSRDAFFHRDASHIWAHGVTIDHAFAMARRLAELVVFPETAP